MIPRPRILAVAGALLLALALAGCGSSDPASQQPVQTTRSPVTHGRGTTSHIAVILMENEEYSSIVGSGATPYINSLAKRYALATSAYAITHPSLPNYLALTGGSTFGIDYDCSGCIVRGGGLAGQLAGRGISWKAYMEDLPHPCFTGAGAGNYAEKHDPFVYYHDVVHDAAQCANVVPLSRLGADERTHKLPRFVWITPNLCHDMHDCAPATGDRFLRTLVPPLLSALGPHGLLILTWDEGASDAGCCRLASGGHIVTILAGGQARPQARERTAVDHYSVLQLIDDLLGLRRLGAAACACTPSLAPLIRTR